MDPRAAQLSEGLSRYLDVHWRPGAQATNFNHIPGGASRETWLFTAVAPEETRGMIVRIDPVTSLIDTDRATEFRAIDAAYKSGIPAPEALFLEFDPEWIGRPFSITAEVPGCMSSAETMPPQHAASMGETKFSILGRIAALDPIALGLEDVMPATTVQTCAMEQVEYWAKVIETDSLHPNPIAAAAIRWLRRNRPRPAQKLSLVHGDYRTGNFLYTAEGEIKAVLDWEMAHIGDPLEDLAWALDPLWSFREPHLAGRLIPHADAIRHWEAASGLTVDRAAFRWWRVFASVKGIGIWISSSEDFHSGADKNPILAVAGWLMTDRQQRILADFLSPHSPQIYSGAAL